MDEESQEDRDARIKSLWKKLDTKDEGELDLPALKSGLSKIDHPLKNADKLIHDVLLSADIDHNGRISFEEFRQFVDATENQLWALFKSIDKDHSGNLDKSELQDAFRRAGLAVPNSRLDHFFSDIDRNDDGVIDFSEWRDFLLFIPHDASRLKAVFSYYTTTVNLSAEGDVNMSDEALKGAGTTHHFIQTSLFGAITQIYATANYVQAPPMDAHQRALYASSRSASTHPAIERQNLMFDDEEMEAFPEEDTWTQTPKARRRGPGLTLTDLVPNPGYFLAGACSGIASRTTTAPLDRLKVYLIAQTGVTQDAVQAAKSGATVQATRHGMAILVNAWKELWAAGGMRSLFAGNGLNIVKVAPESAVKFGSYEAAKRAIAQLEGHDDPKDIDHVSQFVAGGVAGMASQAVVYPLDTLKFRLQCETTKNGLHGNALVLDTARKMWRASGLSAFYRGLPMGIAGMFPYAAIDLGTFEFLKRRLVALQMKRQGGHEDDCVPGNFTLALMGGVSGAFGASVVYPVNLLRTRLQSQGTAGHPRTYTGIMDVTRQTLKYEGVRGLFNGLTPNLLKVVPAMSITYVVYENTKKALDLA